MRKVFSGLRSESPKTLSCTVRNCLLGCFARCETEFARCERLFWDSWPRGTKSLLALSLKHFWAFWLFRHLYQASGGRNATPEKPQDSEEKSAATRVVRQGIPAHVCTKVLPSSSPKLGATWLLAQKLFEARNRPKPPQTPKFPENPAFPQNPPGIPTEFIYIYIYAVGSITWPYFGQSRVDNLAMVGSITWPSFFEPIKIGVFGDFWCTVFRGWCKISVFEKKNLVKKGVSEKQIVHLFFGEFWLYFLVAA